jgi:hypothetical protein
MGPGGVGVKIRIPEYERDVCDFCKRAGCLQECHVCGREFCLSHQGIIPATWGFTTICIECADRDDVQMICQNYAEELTPIYISRDEALKQLPAIEG